MWTENDDENRLFIWSPAQEEPFIDGSFEWPSRWNKDVFKDSEEDTFISRNRNVRTTRRYVCRQNRGDYETVCTNQCGMYEPM